MPRLILMCAPSFAGKTTLSKRIAARLGCPRVSLDEINGERGLDGGAGIPVEEWEKTSWIAIDRVRSILRRGQDVVVDDTACFRFLRDRYREAASECGAVVRIVYIDVPETELRRRIAANRQTRDRPDIADEVFQSHFETFEVPGTDEEPLIFHPREDPEVWIRDQLLVG